MLILVSNKLFEIIKHRSVCQKPPSDYVNKIVDFILYVSETRQRNNYQGIYAADETAVYLDPSGGKCIDERVANEVSVLTTAHDKARITLMLTARSDGKKMKPFVLLPRKRMDKEAKSVVEKYKSKLELCWKGTAPDVSWNGPFKAHLRSIYDRWTANDAQKEFMKSEDCGITICHDGSEHDQLHCFKAHGPIPEGQFELMAACSAIRQGVTETEEVDAEQDEENEYISDQSLEFENDDVNSINAEFTFFH